MDFKDILSYRPSTDLNDLGRSDEGPAAPAGGPATERGAGKRKRDGDGFALPLPKASRATEDAGGAGEAGAAAAASEAGAAMTEEEDERTRALRMMEADTAPVHGPGMDASDIRRLIHGLERKITKNTQMRMKHSDDPTKFLESEADLHDHIKEVHAIATAPEHYGEVIRLGGIKTIVNLLNHDNEDIVADVIALLQEMTDADTLDAGEDDAAALIKSLLDADLLPVLMDAFGRFKDTPDSEGLQTALGIFENMLDLDPSLAERLVKECDILKWLVARVRSKKYDPIKLYASEILAILLQNSDANRSALTDIGGLDRLLQAVSQYKRKDPASGEEHEMMQNLFGCLCSAVMLTSNLQVFIDAEGVELMIIMLRERRTSMHGALKLLDHLMSQGEASEAACAAFVDRGGLRSLFPAFMKTPSGGKGWRRIPEAEYEEHTVSIVSSLVRTLRDPALAMRVLRKFVESDFAKLERLIELHIKYLDRVRQCEEGLKAERAAMEARGEEFDDLAENDHYLKRLDAGLHTLQHVDLIVGEVVYKCGAAAADRAARLLRLKGSPWSSLSEVLSEFADNIDESTVTGAATKADVHAVISVLTGLHKTDS
eukprot:m.193312 g.193312  ORF g.193312 m.193312 type:complete len:601 (-) comp18896_c0_seq1:31-1833(-)